MRAATQREELLSKQGMLGIVHLPTHSSTTCPEGSLFPNLRFPARRHLFGREAESQAWSSLHGAIDRTAAMACDLQQERIRCSLALSE
jgi:hypothetical protein